MAASPSLKLVGHDEPDAGACSEPTLAPRTRDQRTTVRAKRSVERWGGDERWTSTKRARGGGGATYTNQPERRPLQCERSTTCESNLKGEGRGEKSSAFLGATVVRKGGRGWAASRVRKEVRSQDPRTHHLPGAFLCTFLLFCALVLFPPQLLSAIVDVFGGSLVHLPRWRAAIEEKVPVDAALEEYEV